MDESPTDLHDGWNVSSPEAQGLDASILRGLATQFEAWPEANVHAILMARNGSLVYERYFTGEDRAWATPLGRVTYDATMKHDIRSITKSVVSLVVGAVRARGWLRDLEAPVFSFFPEYTDLCTAEKAALTVRHLLTMATGLAWNEEIPYSNPANSERQMLEAADPLRYVLAQPLVRPPGHVYNYNGGATALLATIGAKVSGDTIEALTRVSCGSLSALLTSTGCAMPLAWPTRLRGSGYGRAIWPKSGSSCSAGARGTPDRWCQRPGSQSPSPPRSTGRDSISTGFSGGWAAPSSSAARSRGLRGWAGVGSASLSSPALTSSSWCWRAYMIIQRSNRWWGKWC